MNIKTYWSLYLVVFVSVFNYTCNQKEPDRTTVEEFLELGDTSSKYKKPQPGDTILVVDPETLEETIEIVE